MPIDSEPFESLKNNKKERIKSILLLNESSKCSRIKMSAMSRFGLVENDLRRDAWLCLHGLQEGSAGTDSDEAAIHSHKEYHQVLMDVNRSLKRFPPGMDEVVRMAMQDQLVNLIIRVLISNKSLHYYQGFHDVCVTFLLVLNEHEAYQLLCKITCSHFIDFMSPTMEATTQLLYLIYAIVELENPSIIRTLNQVSVEPFFALPWVITWFGHVLGDLSRILRVYDFFLASDPIMPIYLSSAIVLYRQDEVATTEVDFGQLHHMLTCLPSNLPIEELISNAMDLYLKHPPDHIVVSNTLPRQINLRLTKIGSDILRRRKGPLGDSIETRTSLATVTSFGSSIMTVLSSANRMKNSFIVVSFVVIILAVLLRYVLSYML